MTGTINGLAFLLSLFAVWFLYQRQGVCARCNGRGRHRDDCPFGQNDE